jgi:transcriptional regulator with XRE-family HTH domain
LSESLENAITQRMSVGDRIRYVMELREIKQTQLAARIGLTQSAISNMVTASTHKPAAPSLLAIARELQVNPQWILDGEGDPFSWAPVTDPAQAELLNIYRAMDSEARDALTAVARAMAPRRAGAMAKDQNAPV